MVRAGLTAEPNHLVSLVFGWIMKRLFAKVYRSWHNA